MRSLFVPFVSTTPRPTVRFAPHVSVPRPGSQESGSLKRAHILALSLAAAVMMSPKTAIAQPFYNLNVIVYNTSTNSAIPGAAVEINQDFGNGTLRWTDGGGFANFGVHGVTVGYSVTAGGYNVNWGSVNVLDHTTVYVGLTVSTRGRYKFTGWTCEWVSSESGANECDPAVEPSSGPPATPSPGGTPEISFPQGFSASIHQMDGGYLTSQALTLPSCRAYVRYGNVGYIALQANPYDGSFQWGAYMYNSLQNFGPWLAIVRVNTVQVDAKNQLYPPHGSLTRSAAPTGSIVAVAVQHLYFSWGVAWIYTPEGWRLQGSWRLSYSSGSASCIMPFSEG